MSAAQDPKVAAGAADQLLQSTCESIVMMMARLIDHEPLGGVVLLKLPDGVLIGKQVTINATEAGGPMNMCRMSVFNPDLAPGNEVARIEFEHEKKGKFGLQHVYSIQSVRRKPGSLVLMENFLASSPETVREADFEPIHSESYAQKMVHETVKEWTHFRAWQLQQRGQ